MIRFWSIFQIIFLIRFVIPCEARIETFNRNELPALNSGYKSEPPQSDFDYG